MLTNESTMLVNESRVDPGHDRKFDSLFLDESMTLSLPLVNIASTLQDRFVADKIEG